MARTDVDDWALFALAARDHAALAELFERHRHYVFRLAWGLLNDESTAEDVVQEVFIKLGSGRLRAQPRAKFTTWLYQVSLYTSREQQRKLRKTWEDVLGQDAMERQIEHRTAASRVDDLADLGRALALLPVRQREVVVLRFLEGFDTRQTAEIVGCREGTVKAHLHKATRTLRRVLEPSLESIGGEVS